MSRALAISQRQAQTLLRAAERERGIIEVNPVTGVITLIPECHAQSGRPIASEPEPETFTSLDQWVTWREKQRAHES